MTRTRVGWSHPDHYTDAAVIYAKRARSAEIAVFVELVLPAIRRCARPLGYAVALHGSCERDLDLIAVPWVETVGSSDELIAAVAAVIRQHTGWGIPVSSVEAKPHGRVSVTIGASGGFHVDLSVVPVPPGAPTGEGRHG